MLTWSRSACSPSETAVPWAAGGACAWPLCTVGRWRRWPRGHSQYGPDSDLLPYLVWSAGSVVVQGAHCRQELVILHELYGTTREVAIFLTDDKPRLEYNKSPDLSSMIIPSRFWFCFLDYLHAKTRYYFLSWDDAKVIFFSFVPCLLHPDLTGCAESASARHKIS